MMDERKPQRRTKRRNKEHADRAERAAEHWLRNVLECVETRRAIRSQWHKVDFFGADVVGKVRTGAHCYVQVTTGDARNVCPRRRKLERIPWHPYDLVFVLELRSYPNPVNRRRTVWTFRVHEYDPGDDPDGRVWRVWDATTPVPPEWFKPWKDNTPPSLDF